MSNIIYEDLNVLQLGIIVVQVLLLREKCVVATVSGAFHPDDLGTSSAKERRM